MFSSLTRAKMEIDDVPPPPYSRDDPYPLFAHQPYPPHWSVQPHINHNTVVANGPGHAPTVIEQRTPKRPPAYDALSCCVLIHCNIVFGVLALVFSRLSRSAADRFDMEKARQMGRISLLFNVTGMIITPVLVVIVLLFH